MAVAAWLFEFLRRDRDWRAVLHKVATQLSELPDDRVRAALDVGAAFEHIEPDRRHAINAYQLAGLGRDRGRSRAIAEEMGWPKAVARLGQLETRHGLGIEPLVAACRALVDLRELAEARKLVASVTLSRDDAGDPRLAGIHAELDGRHGEWVGWAAQGREMTGTVAAERFVIAARLARGAGRDDWRKQLEAALVAAPGHAHATAMLTDAAFATKDRNAVIELLRLVTANLELAPYVDRLRALATRLVVAGAGRGGLTRRLLQTALDRAYAGGMTEIGGHLAMWQLLATAAADDGSSPQLLPHVMRGMNTGITAIDRTWLAALGATICIEAGDREAGTAWAGVVAEHAPSHPIVRELVAASAAAARNDEIRAQLADIELDARIVVPIPDAAPKDDADADFGLARTTGPAHTERIPVMPAAQDPRFVDTRVRALDEDDVPSRAATTKPRPAAPSTPEPAKPAASPIAVAAAVTTAPKQASPPPPKPAPEPPKPVAVAPVATQVATRVAAPAPAKPDATAPPARAARAATVDDEWDVDEQIFPPKRRPTTPPPSVATLVTPTVAPATTPIKPVLAPIKPAPVIPAPVPAPAPAPVPAPAPAPTPALAKPTATPATALAKSSQPLSVIPSAAMNVLKSAGAPRALPKLVPPNAIPRAPRTPVAVDVRLRQGERDLEVHTRDFSATGFFAVTTAALGVGDTVECDVRLPAPTGLAEQTFAVRAKVVRRELAGYGMLLVEPPAAMVAAITALGTTHRA